MKEEGQGFLGVTGELPGHVGSAILADGVFEDAFTSSVALGHEVGRFRNVIKGETATYAVPEGGAGFGRVKIGVGISRFHGVTVSGNLPAATICVLPKEAG